MAYHEGRAGHSFYYGAQSQSFGTNNNQMDQQNKNKRKNLNRGKFVKKQQIEDGKF